MDTEHTTTRAQELQDAFNRGGRYGDNVSVKLEARETWEHTREDGTTWRTSDNHPHFDSSTEEGEADKKAYYAYVDLNRVSIYGYWLHYTDRALPQDQWEQYVLVEKAEDHNAKYLRKFALVSTETLTNDHGQYYGEIRRYAPSEDGQTWGTITDAAQAESDGNIWNQIHCEFEGFED